MSRKDELLKLIGDNSLLLPLVDEVLYIEEQLKELRKDNFIKRNPNNPQQTKPDVEKLRQYKDFSNIYDNKLRLIARVTGIEEAEEESPLRKWAANYANKE